MITPTEAGMKLLRRYLEAERNTAENIIGPRLFDATLADGSPCKVMIFGFGDGGAKAAAMKLQRQGLARVTWKRGCSHLLIITDAGRAAAHH